MKNLSLIIACFVALSLLFTLTFADQSFTNELDHVAEQDHVEKATAGLMSNEPSLLLPSQKPEEGQSISRKEVEGKVSEQRPADQEQNQNAYVQIGDEIVVFELPRDQLAYHQIHDDHEEDEKDNDEVDDDDDDTNEKKEKHHDDNDDNKIEKKKKHHDDDDDDDDKNEKKKKKHHDDDDDDDKKEKKKEKHHGDDKKSKDGKNQKEIKQHKHHKEHKKGSKFIRKIRKFLAHF